MNIAVLLDKELQSGGGFQSALSYVVLLNKNKSPQYNFIFFTTLKGNIKTLDKLGIKAELIKISSFDKACGYLRSINRFNKIIRKLRLNRPLKLDRIFKKHAIDLVYFVSSSSLHLAMENYNYIYTLWDLCHRDHPEFPEVSLRGEFELRENLFCKALLKAVQVIVDSELGKENVIRRYGVDIERVSVLPFVPSESVLISDKNYSENFIDIKKKYKVDGDYIYYPAQFWSHKNHIYILEGLNILKKKYQKTLTAIFSGSDKGNLQYILNKARELGVEKQIKYIGFVENKELPYLYRQALALTMPTYFGPTNVPPIEALIHGCPVLYSDLPGLREQMEGAALFLDLNDPESLAKNLLKVISRTDEVDGLVKKGKKIVFGSDTTFSKNLIFLAKNADLLIHESTFSHKDKENAQRNFHSTTVIAANVAKEAEVKQLILNHFSSRYGVTSKKNKTDEKDLLIEAQNIFPDTLMAEDFMEYII